MKKQAIIIFICLIISSLSFAQVVKKRKQKVEVLPSSGFILKLHPIGAIYYANPNIGIDYILNEKKSIQLELGYKLKGAKNYVDAPYQYRDLTLPATPFNLLKRFEDNNIKVKSGIDIRLGYKMYVSDWSKGYYFMPQLRYGTTNNDLNVIFNPQGLNYNASYKKVAYAGAFMVGYQGFYKDRLCYDIYAGPGREQFSEKFTYLNGTKPTTDWGNDHSESFKGQFNWKFHIGLLVGYRFGKGKIPSQTVNKNGTGLLD